MTQSVHGSLERQASDQENGEHHIRKERGEVDYLAGRLYPLHDYEVDDDPRDDQAEQHPPLDTSEISHGVGNV